MMKKILLIVIFCIILSFSFAFGEDTDPMESPSGSIELHVLEDVLESDFTGVWVPFMRYIRFLNDAFPVGDEYTDDFILINNQKIYIKLMGNLFSNLAYKYDQGEILAVLFNGTESEIRLSMQLVEKNYMLYSVFFDGKIQIEFICYKKGTL